MAAECAMELRPRTDRRSYHEAPGNKRAKPAHRPVPLLGAAAPYEERCCPSSIPQKLLAILENDAVNSSQHPLHAYMEFEGKHVPYQTMCHLHLQKFAEAIPKTESLGLPLKAEEDRRMPSPANRRRRASLSDVTDCTPAKRFRLIDPTLPARGPAAARDGSPQHDRIRDEAYRQQVLKELEWTNLDGASHGAQTNDLIRKILLKSRQPTADEAHFCRETKPL